LSRPTAIAIHDDCYMHCRVLYIAELMGKKSAAHRPDDGLHVIEIAIQGRPARFGDLVGGPRPAILEGLRAGDIAGVLELAGMAAEIAVADREQPLELVERHLLAYRQRAHDAEPDALVDQAIDFRGAIVAGGRRRRFQLASLALARGERRAGLSLRGHSLLA